MMTASIDFAVKVAGTGRYANVDATKIMAAGFSCGGVEAMAMSWDPRVKTIGIYSSGLLTNYTSASTFTKPLVYIIGGSGDVAYQNVGCGITSLFLFAKLAKVTHVFLNGLKMLANFFVPSKRPSATSKPSPPAPRRGRETSPSATAATSSATTAASSAAPASPGSSTSSAATRRPRATSWATGTRRTGGRLRRARWTS